MRSLATALLATSLLASPALAKPNYPDTTHGDRRPYPIRALLKFSRGLMNMTFCWIEPFTNPVKEGWRIENEGGNTLAVTAGMTAGVLSGTGYAAARFGLGAIDAATFFMPTPPVMNPETPFGFFESLGTDDADHRLVRVTPPHRIDPEPPRRLNLHHGL